MAGDPSTLRPLFLFSVPRSGSTFVQRVLAAHDGIATTAEPWVLLPLAAALYRGPHGTQRAIGEFLERVPDGRKRFEADLRELTIAAYARAASEGDAFFLDKTPNYYLIAQEIIELFPDGRFVFLWRHPLSVAASAMETFSRRGADNGYQWDPNRFRIDFHHGPVSLVRAADRYRDRVCSVRYEDLIDGDAAEWERVLDYIGVPFDPRTLTGFDAVRLAGTYQDPGVDRYRRVSREPLGKWRQHFAPPLRRAWADRYLEWLGPEVLATMGYDQAALRTELGELAPRWRGTPRDLADIARGRLRWWRAREARWAWNTESWRNLLGDRLSD